MAKFKKNNLQLKDNQKVILGDNNDSSIFFDGSSLKLNHGAIITTGTLKVQGGAFRVSDEFVILLGEGESTLRLGGVDKGKIIINSPAGEVIGGTLNAYVGNDYDASITYYTFGPNEDDLLIGPSNDEDSLKYDGGTGIWNFTGAAGVEIDNDLTVGRDLTINGDILIGDSTSPLIFSDVTNELITIKGDIKFIERGGLIFSEIYGYNTNIEHTISGTGVANKVQITSFNNNGETNGDITPDSTSSDITINVAGRYMVTVSITSESVSGPAAAFSFGLWTNNGSIQYENVHAHRSLGGGGGDRGSITMNGICNFSVSDTVELWIHNITNSQNIIISYITLSITQIGGVG